MIGRFVLGAAALIAGCAPVTTRLSGFETRGATDSPRVVPAAVTTTRDGVQLELVTADGAVFTGPLTLYQQPVLVTIAATGQPLVGGAREYAGDVSGPGGAMACRFVMLNPTRGIDGGGSGRCDGTDRRVDFVF